MASDSNPSPSGASGTSSAPARPALDAGRTTLGKYQIVRQLGAGGMGTVYLVVDTQLKRTVALKVLPRDRADNETLVRRFEAEAQSAAQLRHENIVTVFDAGQIDGHLFIALEYVDGSDVYDLVAKRGVLPLKRSIDFVKQIAQALEHLHKRGFVHRDIKPSNLLVTKEGTVKLTDMGLARAVDESLESGITREGTTVGTVDYMSPEQARNSQAADIRSDIYSLGCTWYQMLTGQPPFPTGSVTNKLYSHISKPRPDPRALNRSVTEDVVAVMHRMMARKPTDRYQTPAELLKELDDIGGGKRRLDELLGTDGNDDLPTTSRPSREAARPLPPRQSFESESHSASSTEHVDSHRTASGPRDSDRTPPRDPGDKTPKVRSRRGSPDAEPQAPPQAPAAPKNARRQTLPPRLRGVSDQPVRMPALARPDQDVEEQTEPVDWRPILIKGASILGGLAAIGLVVWISLSWGASGSHPGIGELSKNPFVQDGDQSPVANPPAADKSDDAEKQKAAEESQKTKAVVVAPKKSEKPGPTSIVLGRPDERAEFPSWLGEIWDPRGTRKSKSAGAPKTFTVGRTDKERADFATLAAAIDALPEEGGVIQLRGRGPFLLPAVRIANRRQVVITAMIVVAPQGNPKNASAAGKVTAANEERPLVALVPADGSSPASGSGLLATETSLTLNAVDLVAFADLFPGENALRLVEVRSGDLTVQNCSLTLLGSRKGPTSAISVSTPVARKSGERPPHILLDRTIVRGRDLTAIDADVRSLDLLAANCLFLCSHAPAINLLAGTGSRNNPGTGPEPLRTLRFFSCTICSDDAAVSFLPSPSVANSPSTRFRVMNSLFAGPPLGPPMIALNNWPIRPKSADVPASPENLTFESKSFVVCGWQKLVQGDAGTQFDGKEAGNWAKFWGLPSSVIDYHTAGIPAIDDLAAADPARFKSEAIGTFPNAAKDSGPPGCDVGLLAIPLADTVRRADAFARRPSTPTKYRSGYVSNAVVREINLDLPGRSKGDDLARHINQSNWISGTRFRVHGTDRRPCGPIHVVNKSLCIEFVDDIPPQLIFEEPKGQARADRQAFITVTGGTIEIIHANFGVEPSKKKSSLHWLLDVKDGSFSIRDSVLEGPAFENPGYEGLIRFSSSAAGTGQSGNEESIWGCISNSFLCTPHSVLSGDIPAGNISIENSVLAANGCVIDLRSSTVAKISPTIDLRSCSLAAGSEYLRLDSAAATVKNRVRVFAENTLFCPPPQSGENLGKPALIGGIPSNSIAERIDWWEYSCAYSNLIALPGSGPGTAASGVTRPLDDWLQLAGPLHIVRAIADANAVVFSRELPRARDIVPADFHLKTEAEAATWTDVGTAVGASLPAKFASFVREAPARPTAPHKTPPARKNATAPTGF